MSDLVREQLSALIDGELPANERELLLQRLSTDLGLRQSYARYVLISHAIRGQLPTQIDTQMDTRLSAAIARESAYAPVPLSWSRFVKPLGGVAVAASVAFMALVGIRQFYAHPDPIEIAERARVPNAQNYQQVSQMRWSGSPPRVSSRLNSYLVNHSEYSSSTLWRGMLQYVRIVGYDVEPE